MIDIEKDIDRFVDWIITGLSAFAIGGIIFIIIYQLFQAMAGMYLWN